MKCTPGRLLSNSIARGAEHSNTNCLTWIEQRNTVEHRWTLEYHCQLSKLGYIPPCRFTLSSWHTECPTLDYSQGLNMRKRQLTAFTCVVYASIFNLNLKANSGGSPQPTLRLDFLSKLGFWPHFSLWGGVKYVECTQGWGTQTQTHGGQRYGRHTALKVTGVRGHSNG